MFPFGLFDSGRKIRKLRKSWDRMREKTLEKEGSLKEMLLTKEDSIEEKLRTLEERGINRPERAKLIKEIQIDLEEIRAYIKSKPEELEAEARKKLGD